MPDEERVAEYQALEAQLQGTRREMRVFTQVKGMNENGRWIGMDGLEVCV